MANARSNDTTTDYDSGYGGYGSGDTTTDYDSGYSGFGYSGSGYSGSGYSGSGYNGSGYSGSGYNGSGYSGSGYSGSGYSGSGYTGSGYSGSGYSGSGYSGSGYSGSGYGYGASTTYDSGYSGYQIDWDATYKARQYCRTWDEGCDCNEDWEYKCDSYGYKVCQPKSYGPCWDPFNDEQWEDKCVDNVYNYSWCTPKTDPCPLSCAADEQLCYGTAYYDNGEPNWYVSGNQTLG
eukprot:g30222.t1